MYRLQIVSLLVQFNYMNSGQIGSSEAAPKRPGRKIQLHPDHALRTLIILFRKLGGEPEVKMKNEGEVRPKRPFEHFLAILWDELPEEFRLKNKRQFLERARDILALKRNDHKGLLQKVADAVELRIVDPRGIAGLPAGTVFEAPVHEGEVWDSYWQARLDEGSVTLVEEPRAVWP